ncbi:Bm8 interacting protein, partial [Operophtera brumata]
MSSAFLAITFSLLFFIVFLISEPISKAKTLLQYNSVETGFLSFRQNAEAIVLMKSAGTNSDLWYAAIDGKSGFVPSKFLKETKILEKSPLVTVPLEVRKKESQAPDVHPDKVKSAHEVIEGTTIYTTEASSVKDSTTENPGSAPSDFVPPTLDTNEESAKRSEETQSEASVSPHSGDSDSTGEVSTSTNTSQSDSDTEGQNLNSDASVEPIPPETVDNKAETEQNVGPANQVLPNHLADAHALSPQDHGASSSETFEVPDLNYVQNTLNEPENVDSNELNTSLPNSNNVENILVTASSSVTPVVSDKQNQLQAKETENINAKYNTVNQDVNTQNTNGIKTENMIENLLSARLKENNINENIKNTGSEDSVKSQNESMIDDEEVRRNVDEQLKGNSKQDSKFENQNEQANAVKDIVLKQIHQNPTQDTIMTSQNEPIIENSNEAATGTNQGNEQIKVNAKGDTTFKTQNEQVNAIEETGLDAQTKQINENATEDTVIEPQNQTIENSKEEATETSKDSQQITENTKEDFVALEEPLYRTTQEPTIPPQYYEETKTEPVSKELPNIPSEPPSKLADTIPPVNIPEAPIPTSSELPPVQQTNPAPDTLKPVFTYPQVLTQPAPSVTPDPNNYNYYSHEPVKYEPSDDNSKVNEPSSENNNEYTTVPPISESFNDNPTEEMLTSTEAPSIPDENSESFLSSMYSTLADIWPSTTEAPPSLFNEEYTKFEEKESSDGFSLMSYLISIYYSVMGPSETCFTDEYCDGKGNTKTNRLLTFLVTTATSVLLFTLGYYYIDSKRQDSRLIGNINSLQRDLLFSSKECEILKEELSTTKIKLAGIEDSSFGMDDMVLSLKEEINEHKAQNERLRNSLDDNEKLLRVSENTAGELQNTLSEVENTLSELWDKIQAFEEELISVSRERDSFQLKYVSAETALEESRRYKKQLDEVELAERKRLAEELQTTQDSYRTTSQQATEAMTRLEVLGKYFQERESELMKELNAKESLWLSKQGESASTVEKIELLQQEVQRFKEKCDALTLELAEQESNRRTAISEVETRAHSAWLEARAARREADAARDEAATLRRKLASVSAVDAAMDPHHKSNRRTAISEVETRAHSAWLEADAARRETDAARDEAATLRRKLASVSAVDAAMDPHHKSNRRTAISEVETRAHSAWLEADAARRETDAARDEAATLRRKLASVSAVDAAMDPHHKSNRRTAISEVETRAHSAWLEADAARRETDAARDEAATLRRKLASVSAVDAAMDPHH